MKAPRPIGSDLLRFAARGVRRLDPGATGRIAAFADSCVDSAGGFRGRGDQADLYYTQFGMALARVLRIPLPRRAMADFLDRHDPARLDLPHLAALAQSWRALHPLALPRPVQSACSAALPGFRTPDGAFGETRGAARGTAYGLYLAVLCSEALRVALPEADRARAAAAGLLEEVLAADVPPVSPLAAAAAACQALGGSVPVERVRKAFLACRTTDGGFRAHARAPLADLLSTGVACFALARLRTPPAGREAVATAAFVESLWDEGGGFRGCPVDARPDCEYTFYAVLALGALEP